MLEIHNGIPPRKGDLIRYTSQSFGENTHAILTGIDYPNNAFLGVVGADGKNLHIRHIPMSNDSIELIRPSPKQLRGIGEFIDEKQLRDAIQQDNFSPLVARIIKANTNYSQFLTPIHFKQFKNRAFAFPVRIEFGTTNKLRIPMWTLNTKGQADIRYLYFSESDGRVHVSPGFEYPSGRLIKGDNFDCSYINGNRVDPEIERFIHTLYARREFIFSDGNPLQLKGFTMDTDMQHNPTGTTSFEYNQYNQFGGEINPWYGSVIFKMLGFFDLSSRPSSWSHVQDITIQRVMQSMYRADEFFQDFIDFSRPSYVYQHFSMIKKQYTVTVFTSYLAGRNIEWHVGSKGDDFWLDNIILEKENPINSFGVHALSVNGGGLISKPWEYKSQVGDRIMSDPQSQRDLFSQTEDPSYVSVEKFLQHNPIARLYKESLA